MTEATSEYLNQSLRSEGEAAKVGHNNPPSPFDEIKQKIEDLYDEAKNFADGEPVANEGQAKAVSLLIDSLRKAEKEADAARIKENEPFDEGKAEVQARYADLIAKTKSKTGKAPLAIELCKSALQPWLQKLADEQAERDRIAREQAEQAKLEKQEALAKRTDSLEAAEEAEAAIRHADAAEATARSIAKDRPNVKGAGAKRAVGLQTTYYPEMTDSSEAMRHYWATRRGDCEAMLLTFAEQDVRAGKSPIPGFVIREKKTVK
jgi:hypothetical protein